MIETERLIIRHIQIEDYDDICEYGCDEETGKYMIHWPKTKQQVEEFINECISSMKTDNSDWYEFVIQLKENMKVIGNITINKKNQETEIGWISNKKYWNKEYMSEAIKVIINYAFSNLGIHRIFATCSDNNIASFKVMEKCNMKRIHIEKSIKAIRQGVEINYNRLTYCIEREENE